MLSKIKTPVFLSLLNALLGVVGTVYAVRILGEESFGKIQALVSTANIFYAFSICGVSDLSIRYLTGNKSLKHYNNLLKISLLQLIITLLVAIILATLGFLNFQIIILTCLFFSYRLLGIICRAHSKFNMGIILTGSTLSLAIIITSASINIFSNLNFLTTYFIVLLIICLIFLYLNFDIWSSILYKSRTPNTFSDYSASLSLGVLVIMTEAKNNIDVLWLNYLGGPEMITEFRLILIILFSFNIYHVVINNIYGPSIARLISDKNISEIRKLWKKSVIIQMFLGCITMATAVALAGNFSETFLGFAFPLDAKDIIAVLIAGLAFAYRSFMPQVLIQLDLTSEVLKLHFFSLMLVIFVSPLLITAYGGTGAMLSYGLGNWLTSGLSIMYFRRHADIQS